MISNEISQNTQLGICSATDWLLIHHCAKATERQQMVADIQIKPGDNVLDLGCGPGLWSRMFSEYVYPHGRVVGIDGLAESIAYARRSLEQKPSSEYIEFHQADFYSIPFDTSSFDITFCGNCLPYVNEPCKLLSEQKRVTKPGGRVISKEYDGAVLVLHPVDPLLLSKVLYATERALGDRDPKQKYDNVPGRKVRTWFQRVGYQDITTKAYAIQKYAPLTPEVERYLRLAIEWYGTTGAPYLSHDEKQQWQAYTDPNSSQFILDKSDFYYCSLDLMTIGTVE